MVNPRVGKPAMEKRWDWNIAVGYRYVETDAVVDGFNDLQISVWAEQTSKAAPSARTSPLPHMYGSVSGG